MSKSNPIGFVCGTKGDSVSFLVNKDVTLSFGQIVRIESGERSFYARVVNSESSSTLEIIEQLREAEGKEAFGPYSAYRSVDGVLTIERMEIGDEAGKKMQEILDSYGTGIQIVTVKLQDVTPPDQVKPAFNAVNEAKQEFETLINQARKEYNTVIPKARGDAEKTIKEAEGYAIDRVNRAEGDASPGRGLWSAVMESPLWLAAERLFSAPSSAHASRALS